jgi:branched-chain amino acid transport system permease protein
VRRLSRVHPDYILLLTFGLSLILTEAIILVWGPVGITSQPPAVLAGGVDLGVTVYPKYRLAVMLVTTAVVAACYLFVTRTRYGAIIRAGIEDKDMAAALGINIRRVFTLTFAAGAGLAALGGALMVPVRGLQPTMGFDILPFAFVVVVLGGLGSLPGAILAGLLVGVVQSLMTAIWPPGADASVFALMTLGIIARPQGLLGQR